MVAAGAVVGGCGRRRVCGGGRGKGEGGEEFGFGGFDGGELFFVVGEFFDEVQDSGDVWEYVLVSESESVVDQQHVYLRVSHGG